MGDFLGPGEVRLPRCGGQLANIGLALTAVFSVTIVGDRGEGRQCAQISRALYMTTERLAQPLADGLSCGCTGPAPARSPAV